MGGAGEGGGLQGMGGAEVFCPQHTVWTDDCSSGDEDKIPLSYICDNTTLTYMYMYPQNIMYTALYKVYTYGKARGIHAHIIHIIIILCLFTSYT